MAAVPEGARISEGRVSAPAERPSRASHTLPPELLADAARRLGWVALIYAGGGVWGYFGRRVLLALIGPIDIAFRSSDLLGLVMIASGVAMYFLARSGRAAPQRLLDVGLVFEVIGALGIAASPIVDHPAQFPTVLFGHVPAECVWITVFPLVVPNTPVRVLVASLLAASMGPLLGWLGATFGNIPIKDPLEFAASYVTTT